MGDVDMGAGGEAISKISWSAIVSAIGGRVRACMIGWSAGRARLVGQALDQLLILVVDRDRQAGRAISRNAASIVGGSMRGNRTGSYS